jgi:hypothetical protein
MPAPPRVYILGSRSYDPGWLIEMYPLIEIYPFVLEELVVVAPCPFACCLNLGGAG